jgi:hypothetical protein
VSILEVRIQSLGMPMRLPNRLFRVFLQKPFKF